MTGTAVSANREAFRDCPGGGFFPNHHGRSCTARIQSGVTILVLLPLLLLLMLPLMLLLPPLLLPLLLLVFPSGRIKKLAPQVLLFVFFGGSKKGLIALGSVAIKCALLICVFRTLGRLDSILGGSLLTTTRSQEVRDYLNRFGNALFWAQVLCPRWNSSKAELTVSLNHSASMIAL